MTTDTAFPFDACSDATACKAGMATIVRPGMDWSEVHCGRCGAQGIIRHADLLPPSAFPAPPEPVPESFRAAERALQKGRHR